MHHPQPTGIFIPAHKKSLLLLAFEKILLDRHNILIAFERAKSGNSWEVKFVIRNKNQLPNVTQWHCKNAKNFLKENLHLIDRKKATPSTVVSPKNLVHNEPALSPRRLSLRSSSTIDLTGDSFQACQPEVIVLDDCQDHTIRSRSSNKVIDIIDLDETSQSLSTTSDIQVVGIKNLKSRTFSNISENEVTVTESTFGKKNSLINDVRRSKRKSNSFIETPRKSKVRKFTSSKKRVSRLENDSKLLGASNSKAKEPRRKKTKLCDVSNIIPTVTSKADSPINKPLSDAVLKYYTDISKAINKRKKSQSPRRKKSLNTVLSKKKSSLSPSVKNPKAKTPKRSSRRFYVPNSMNNRSPALYKQQKVPATKNVKCDHERNIFNPNPNVDIEGLRPIAIDGSNVAVGHGKGIFSTKGLKICVDYFANQGHKNVKVFLPLYRQNCFSKALLEELNSKCTMVFTPSRVINGRQTSSYDDRFIVQYAVEFGAVVVSTDNFRDLLAENPRWTKTIQERLLMFTWIDDFLMFPMDPMGKNGPNLDEFLKF